MILICICSMQIRIKSFLQKKSAKLLPCERFYLVDVLSFSSYCQLNGVALDFWGDRDFHKRKMTISTSKKVCGKSIFVFHSWERKPE